MHLDALLAVVGAGLRVRGEGDILLFSAGGRVGGRRLGVISNAGFEAVSAWGLAIMTLLVVTAGTIAIRRAMRRGQAVAG